MAISAALQDAIACTVCKWLCTKNHLGTSTSARPGSIRDDVRQDRGEIGHPRRRRRRRQAGAARTAGKVLPHLKGAARTGHVSKLYCPVGMVAGARGRRAQHCRSPMSRDLARAMN